MSERLGSQPFSGCWSLRPPPGASFWAQARVDGLPQRAAFMVGLHLLLTAVTILGYTLLGYAALEGRLELGWLLGWGLLLLTEVPVYLYVQWLQGELVVSFGKLLKRRLLAGALRMDADDIGRAGAGQLTGRALEVQSIDSLALGGGVRSILAITEVVPLAVWLSWGTGGLGPALMLGTFLLISFSLGWGAYLRARRWADAQRGLSQELVERMLGHRTRLVQQPEDRRHEGEDPPLARYLSAAREVDGYEVILQALPYAWMILGLAFVAPGFIRGDSSGQVAIAVGGTLLAFASFLGLGQGLMQIAHAAAGWQQLSPLFDAGALPVAQPSPAIEAIHSDESGTGVLLDATGLTFRYPDRQEPVLRDVHLHVRRGDRVLLEGPSGGGKTTLASVLSGLRQPTSGLLLLDGFDFPTLGERGWRARVAAAPQYHENHVFMDSFAFNAQLGATAGREDEDEAHEVLEELGLDDLIARMPGGLDQQVGESGWRLSHGERSRLFIARALIQKAPLVVLDESFGALDPKTMARCLRCVLKRAPTLIVIAHP